MSLVVFDLRLHAMIAQSLIKFRTAGYTEEVTCMPPFLATFPTVGDCDLLVIATMF